MAEPISAKLARPFSISAATILRSSSSNGADLVLMGRPFLPLPSRPPGRGVEVTVTGVAVGGAAPGPGRKLPGQALVQVSMGGVTLP